MHNCRKLMHKRYHKGAGTKIAVKICSQNFKIKAGNLLTTVMVIGVRKRCSQKYVIEQGLFLQFDI